MTDPKANLPQGKQTTLKLYVTAKEAYEKWQAEPDKVKIIDVRTPEEYLFVGHPPMAWKIPVADQSYEWDPEKQQYPMKPLMDFIARVQTIAQPDDTLMLTGFVTADPWCSAIAASAPTIPTGISATM